MDKKTQKEFDKEVDEIRKTTLLVNKRMKNLIAYKNGEEEESDEENEELEDYLNNTSDEQVSEILQKAEEEMKAEEKEKKRQENKKKNKDKKMEKMLKDELEKLSDEEKRKKKNKKNKKEKNNDNDEEVQEYIEFKKWQKMKKLQQEKMKEKNDEEKEEDLKEKNNNNIKNSEEKEEIKEINKNKNEEIKDNEKEDKKKDEKQIKKMDNNNNNEKENDNEFDFNFNLLNDNDTNGDNNNLKIDINNNNDNNMNNQLNGNQNNNNIQSNNKPEQFISPNLYKQVNSNDLNAITNLIKGSNMSLQQGESFFSMGKYSDAMKCYEKAKVNLMALNQLLRKRKNVYPKEFSMKITSKINEKMQIIHQASKKCSTAMKEKIIGNIVNKASIINNKTVINNNLNYNMNNNTDNNINGNININNENNFNNNMNNNIQNNINNNIDINKGNNDIQNNNNGKYNNQNNNIKNKTIIKSNSKNINNNNYNFDFNALNNNNNGNNNYNNNNNLRNNQNNPNKPKSLYDKEEDAMDQKIMSEIMSKNPGVKFSDIIGMNDMKQTLYEIIVVPTIRPDLFTGIRTPQRGILLFGPPGTGKTMIAKAIASECGSTFFNISASSLTSKWVGESEKTVRSLFKIAYQKVPSIIFIDEIDSILSKRSESENEATKRLKTEFLIQFDGLGSNTSARLLVIAATNRPMDLDEALLRRLPKRVYCGPLDEDGRFEFIKKVINRVDTDLSDEDIREIAKLTNDYSNSDLMEMCREAAYRPVRELTNEQIMKLDKFRPITKKDMLDAVHKIRGTLSKKVKDELKRWNDQFGGV